MDHGAAASVSARLKGGSWKEFASQLRRTEFCRGIIHGNSGERSILNVVGFLDDADLLRPVADCDQRRRAGT
jgi:hypothetical protein